jgi:hypothetical protein
LKKDRTDRNNEDALVSIDRHCRLPPLKLLTRTERQPEGELLKEDVGSVRLYDPALRLFQRYALKPPNAIEISCMGAKKMDAEMRSCATCDPALLKKRCGNFCHQEQLAQICEADNRSPPAQAGLRVIAADCSIADCSISAAGFPVMEIAPPVKATRAALTSR